LETLPLLRKKLVIIVTEGFLEDHIIFHTPLFYMPGLEQKIASEKMALKTNI